MAGSPYLIMDDITILFGSDLIIDPSVDILFQGHYKKDAKGSVNANGPSDNRITFTSDTGTPWNGIRFAFSDYQSGYYIIKLQKSDGVITKNIIIQQ